MSRSCLVATLVADGWEHHQSYSKARTYLARGTWTVRVRSTGRIAAFDRSTLTAVEIPPTVSDGDARALLDRLCAQAK